MMWHEKTLAKFIVPWRACLKGMREVPDKGKARTFRYEPARRAAWEDAQAGVDGATFGCVAKASNHVASSGQPFRQGSTSGRRASM